MYNVKTPTLPTAVGKEARIISKLQQVVDVAVRKGLDFDWIAGISGLLTFDHAPRQTGLFERVFADTTLR
jgi:hypothetical protein